MSLNLCSKCLNADFNYSFTFISKIYICYKVEIIIIRIPNSIITQQDRLKPFKFPVVCFILNIMNVNLMDRCHSTEH